MIKVGIIGAGNMGSAIASSLEKKNDYSVYLFNRTKEKAEKVAREKSITVLSSISQMKDLDVIILAVKPLQVTSIYPLLSSFKSPLFISLLAGVTLETLKKNLESERVVRFMPNIGALASSSVTALTYSEELSSIDREISLDIAKSFGSAFFLEEKLFNAFIGISGSAIAFVFEFMHSLALSGVREGIGYKESLEIVEETINSAIKLQKTTEKSAIELETMVCSPKGTTIEGLKKLKELGFEFSVMEAVKAVTDKCKEIENNTKQ